MDEHEDHESLTDYPIDEDYVDPPDKQPADVNVSDDAVDSYERDPQFLPPKKSTDLSHTYGRQAGDGVKDSVSEEIDQRKIPERDDRGGTRTGMDISNVDGYYKKEIIRSGKLRTRAEWLRMLQDGYRDNYYRDETFKMDNDAWIETFASKLSLTEYQTTRISRIIDSVKLNHFGRRTVEIVVLAAIQYVAGEDNRDVTSEEMFKTLVATTDTSLSEVERTKELLESKSPLL
jgi:hypothetical protein